MDSSNEELDRYLREDLGALLQLVQHSDIHELDVREGDIHIYLRRACQPLEHEGVPHALAAEGTETGSSIMQPVLSLNGEPASPVALSYISAPMVGIYRGIEPVDGATSVTEGTFVEPGTMIGVIEALGVETEVEVDCRGTVQRFLVTDGDPVEYGQKLAEVLLEDQ